MDDDNNVVSFPRKTVVSLSNKSTDGKDALITLLDGLIADVKNDKLIAIGCVLVNPDHDVDLAFGGFGPFMNDLVAGTEYLKDELKMASREA